MAKTKTKAKANDASAGKERAEAIAKLPSGTSYEDACKAVDGKTKKK